MFALLRAFFVWLLRLLRPLRLPGEARRAPRRGAPEPARREPARREPGRRDGRRGAQKLEITYAPGKDGEADPGEVVWTWVPFEDDPSQGKDRPVLVIGRRSGRRVGLALTSKDSDRGDRIEIGAGSWDREGRTSYAKLDRLIDLEAAPIRREGAVLDRARFDAVARALRGN
jgi:hypothetical protein